MIYTMQVDAQDVKHKAADSRAKVLLQEIEQHTKDRDEAELMKSLQFT